MQRKHLLLVDDEPIFRNSLADHLRLKRPNLDISTSASGALALELLKSQPVDLVVTDVRMPDLDGMSLLAAIVSERIEVIVVLITAYVTEELRSQAIDAGAAKVLDKPLDLRQLLEVVDASLGPKDEEGSGISIAGFLELIQLERKSCRVLVSTGSEEGLLVFQAGVLKAAELKELTGDRAAREIVGWKRADIRLESGAQGIEANVDFSLPTLLADSSAGETSGLADDQEMVGLVQAAAESSGRVKTLPGDHSVERERRLSLERLEWLDGFVAAALVDPATSSCSYSAGRIGLTRARDAALMFADVVALEEDILILAGSSEEVGTMIMVTEPINHYLRIIEGVGILYLAIDGKGSNLALTVRELDVIALQYAVPAPKGTVKTRVARAT